MCVCVCVCVYALILFTFAEGLFSSPLGRHHSGAERKNVVALLRHRADLSWVSGHCYLICPGCPDTVISSVLLVRTLLATLSFVSGQLVLYCLVTVSDTRGTVLSS